jgi:predicted GNAT family acetyltransferase
MRKGGEYLKVHRFSDARSFLAAAEPWLSTAEVESNVILGIARSVADGSRTLKEPPYFAAALEDDQITCCAIRTPPHAVLVTRGKPRDLTALAGDAFEVFRQLPGVVGPCEAAAGFVEAWLALAGGRATASMRQRLYKIERLEADVPAIQGRLREATPNDRDLALEWCVAFEQEAIPNHPSDAEDAVDRHLKHRTLYFWDDGRPVTMCATPTGNSAGSRINLVYTPRDLRRRGYATAAVSALTRRLLDDGRQYCCLYADLANPTSNGIYQQIGYRPVCDFDEYSFAAL